MTWRELKVFISHLPRDSATSRAVNGDAAEWTATTHVVANLWDALVAIHTAEGDPPRHPRPDLPDDPPDN